MENVRGIEGMGRGEGNRVNERKSGACGERDVWERVEDRSDQNRV